MEFKSLEFNISKDTEKGIEYLYVSFYGSFYFKIPLSEVRRIDKHFKLNPKNSNEIIFTINQEKAEKKFMFLIQRFMNELKSKITENKTIYLHENSDIPLFGLQFIGIIDKGTDMIEVKPLTSCNLNCSFCSVGEGVKTRKQIDFVVEEEYLVDELSELLDLKVKHDPKTKISVWINPHGEPFLYSRLLDLVKDIAELTAVKDVHIITSGTLLNKKIIDDLSDINKKVSKNKNNKLKLSISISTLNEKIAKKIMGLNSYDPNHVLEMIEYATKKEIETIITPVYLLGVNDNDIEQLIDFSKKHKLKISIQKFCSNKFGRNPIKETNWENFTEKLKEWEKLYGKELVQTGEIGKSKELERPFKKDDVIQAEIKFSGRFLRDKVAVAKDRCILIPNCQKQTGKTKATITSTKYGVYLAKG